MDKYTQAVELLLQYITEKKLRRTPERFHLLKAVYDYDKHFTADELYEHMKSKFRVSRATVYSNLDLFVQAGLVVKTLVLNSVQYEKCLGMKPHHHMICTQCGAVKEFEDEKIDYAVNSIKYRRFKHNTYSLCVYGLCYKCQAKVNRAKRKALIKAQALQLAAQNNHIQ